MLFSLNSLHPTCSQRESLASNKYGNVFLAATPTFCFDILPACYCKVSEEERLERLSVLSLQFFLQFLCCVQNTISEVNELGLRLWKRIVRHKHRFERLTKVKS